MDKLPSEDEFRLTAVGYWTSIASSFADDANVATARGDEIVLTWRENGVADELLRGLLRDESEEVRFAAAAHLGSGDAEARGCFTI
ncbi:MAG: hypothetical protein ACT452_19340 [Microthrixaceae bacterium]